MNQNFIETERVKNLLDEYFQAVCHADKLKTIFHEQASMADDGIDCRYVIKSLQVTENIASATLFVDNFFGASCIEDQFHLLKVDGEWRILCKTFITIPG